MCEWFLSPYPWPGRLSDCCAAGWTGGGAAVGVAASTGAGAATGAAVWTTGAADVGGLGCVAGGDGVGVGVGVGLGVGLGLGVGVGVGVGDGVGVTAGGVGLGGCGARTFVAPGVCDDGVAIRIGFPETSPAFAGVFRTTFGARRPV